MAALQRGNEPPTLRSPAAAGPPTGVSTRPQLALLRLSSATSCASLDAFHEIEQSLRQLGDRVQPRRLGDQFGHLPPGGGRRQLVLSAEPWAPGVYPPSDALYSLSRSMRLGTGHGRPWPSAVGGTAALDVAATVYAAAVEVGVRPGCRLPGAGARAGLRLPTA